jgi:glycerophosphoryl diester phosphodiesterase
MKKLFLCFLSALFLLSTLNSCGTKPATAQTTEQVTAEITKITPLPLSELTVILHAGGGWGGQTHLNAQETFEYYYNQGYRYFEYDLKLSTDGRIIATHDWEHLELYRPEITYDEFKSLRLDNGYTPANEEWLMETIMQYPDIKIVVDAKMDSTEGDAAVLARLEALESIYNYDISANILPEIFSKEMWDIAKETTTFDGYLFSHYKVYYSVGQILEYFDDPRIVGIALPSYTDNYIRSNIYKFKESKKIYVFTPLTKEEAADAASMGADGIYLNFPEIIS